MPGTIILKIDGKDVKVRWNDVAPPTDADVAEIEAAWRARNGSKRRTSRPAQQTDVSGGAAALRGGARPEQGSTAPFQISAEAVNQVSPADKAEVERKKAAREAADRLFAGKAGIPFMGKKQEPPAGLPVYKPPTASNTPKKAQAQQPAPQRKQTTFPGLPKQKTAKELVTAPPPRDLKKQFPKDTPEQEKNRRAWEVARDIAVQKGLPIPKRPKSKAEMDAVLTFIGEGQTKPNVTAEQLASREATPNSFQTVSPTAGKTIDEDQAAITQKIMRAFNMDEKNLAGQMIAGWIPSLMAEVAVLGDEKRSVGQKAGAVANLALNTFVGPEIIAGKALSRLAGAVHKMGKAEAAAVLEGLSKPLQTFLKSQKVDDKAARSFGKRLLSQTDTDARLPAPKVPSVLDEVLGEPGVEFRPATPGREKLTDAQRAAMDANGSTGDFTTDATRTIEMLNAQRGASVLDEVLGTPDNPSVRPVETPQPPAAGVEPPAQTVTPETRQLPDSQSVGVSTTPTSARQADINATPREPDTTIASKNAVTADIRRRYNLDELPPTERKAWEDVLNEADAANGMQIVDEVMSGSRTSVNSTEQASILKRLDELDKEYEDLSAGLDTTDSKVAERIVKRMAEVQSEIDDVTTVLKTMGAETARTLASRRNRLDPTKSLPLYLAEANARMVANKGRKLNAKETANLTKQYNELKDKLDAATKRIEELEAGKAIKRRAGQKRTRNTQAIVADMEVAKRELLQAVSTIGANPFLNPDVHKAFAKLVKLEIEAGVSKLEDLLRVMRSHLDEAGVTATDSEIRRAIAEMDKPEKLPLTPEAQAAKDAAAKTRETTSKIKTEAKVIEQEAEIATGNMNDRKQTKPDVDPELQRLRNEARLLEGEIQKRLNGIGSLKSNKGLAVVKGVTNIGRFATLGGDFGSILRQGLFGLSHALIHPRSYSKTLTAAFKGMGSDAALLAVEDAALLKRSPSGKLYEPIRRKAGLNRTSVIGVQEETLVADAIAKVWEKTLGRIPVLKDMGGSLGRGQASFLNTLRNEMFDSFLDRHPDATLEELTQWASFINSSTGRSNLQQVPEILDAILTSPRYEASRWEMVGRYMASPVTFAKAFKNRAARRELYTMMSTGLTLVAAGTAYAKARNAFKDDDEPDVEFVLDPWSSDFLKLRGGDFSYDMTAGIGPRIRSALRAMMFWKNPEDFTKITKASEPYKKNETLSKEFLGASTRPITPLISGGVEERTGYGLGGYREDEEDVKGWARFMPLILQGLQKDLKEGNDKDTVVNGLFEFFGGSVGRYPKPQK